MKINWHDFRFSLFASIFLIIIGLITSYLTTMIFLGRFVPWKSLGSPPGGALQFVDIADKDYIEVRTATSFYRYDFKEDNHVWVEVPTRTIGQRNRCRLNPNLDSSDYHFPGQTRWIRSGEPVDCIQWGEYIDDWSSDWFVFVILDDGNVLIWRHITNHRYFLFTICCPMPLILVIGWTTILIKRRKLKPSSVVDSPPVSENTGDSTES